MVKTVDGRAQMGREVARAVGVALGADNEVAIGGGPAEVVNGVVDEVLNVLVAALDQVAVGVLVELAGNVDSAAAVAENLPGDGAGPGPADGGMVKVGDDHVRDVAAVIDERGAGSGLGHVFVALAVVEQHVGQAAAAENVGTVVVGVMLERAEAGSRSSVGQSSEARDEGDECLDEHLDEVRERKNEIVCDMVCLLSVLLVKVREW